MLTQGKVMMANMGGDDAILRAMRSNEDDTNEAYEAALEHAPADARDIVRRGREDEKRHWDWISAQLGEGHVGRGTAEQRRNTPPPPNY
jgi:rubrerythrin